MTLRSIRARVYALWRRAGLTRSTRPGAWYRYGAEVIATARGIEISGHAVADLAALLAPLTTAGIRVATVDGFAVIVGAP
jgi:hypothetical protein